MKGLEFLDSIIAWAQRPEVSLLIKMTVKTLVILSSFFPGPAYAIMQMVERAFDSMDKDREKGYEVSLEQKRSYTENIVDVALVQYHGSGSLLSESWIRQVAAGFVHVLGVMRYGENIERDKLAVQKGVMSTNQDVKEVSEKIDAAFPLFGVK